ncbi:MAG: hypothetical protein ACYC4Q_06715 [Victivallaceae bacterium]
MNKAVINVVLSLLIIGNIACGMSEPPGRNSQKDFYLGVHMYYYSFAKAAEENNKDFISFFSEHLKILNSHGINAIYFAVGNDKSFDEILECCKKYDIKLIPQLDFAYFRDKWTEEEMDKNAKKAGEFIRKYDKHPQILSWSVKEEVPQEHINSLSRYYMKILQYAPDAKFNLIHSSLGAAKDQPVPDPVISGTDRYAFWWEFSGNGYLASPYFALDWFRKQAAAFQAESAKRGADFMLVVTQGGLMLPKGANVYGNGEYDKIKSVSSLDEKKKIVSRVKVFAEQGRMGWKKFDSPEGTRYNVWKYYRLPGNCMKALAWTGVMEGARLFFCWSYTPLSKEKVKLNFKSAAFETDKSEIVYITLAGRPGISNPQLEEFAEAGREIRKFSQIITTMSKNTDSPVITDTKSRVFNRAFHIPTIPGTIVVIHNGNTGKWPADSRAFFKDEDDIRIDDEGNMVGYVPFKDPMKVSFSVSGKDEKEDVYDLASGLAIKPDNGKYAVEILPGSGTMIYIGSKENAQKISALVKK